LFPVTDAVKLSFLLALFVFFNHTKRIAALSHPKLFMQQRRKPRLTTGWTGAREANFLSFYQCRSRAPADAGLDSGSCQPNDGAACMKVRSVLMQGRPKSRQAIRGGFTANQGRLAQAALL